MSDNQSWQAPGAAASPPTTPPAPGMPSPVAPTQVHGWTPPPKPGLIPLRPMTLGTILGASFQVMRRNPRATLGPALILSVIIALVTALGLTAYIGALTRIDMTSNPSDAAALMAGTVLIALLVMFAGVAAVVVATAVLQAIIVTEVARATVGEKQTLRGLLAMVKGRLGAVVGYTLLLILAGSVGIALFFGLTVAIAAGTATATTTNDIAGGIVLVFGLIAVGSIGAAVLWLWLGTKLAFVPASIVLERLPVFTAIARSWRLVRGYFWRVLGIQLLVSVMVYVASQVVSIPLSLVASLGGTLLFPTGGSPEPASFIAIAIVVGVVSALLVSIVTAVGLVLQSATASLLYLDLRMRKEGLDLELSRFVESRTTGVAVADPYLPSAV